MYHKKITSLMLFKINTINFSILKKRNKKNLKKEIEKFNKFLNAFKISGKTSTILRINFNKSLNKEDINCLKSTLLGFYYFKKYYDCKIIISRMKNNEELHMALLINNKYVFDKNLYKDKLITIKQYFLRCKNIISILRR